MGRTITTIRFPRAKKIRTPLGPYLTSATSFERGKDRDVEIVTITPAAIVYRVKGSAERFLLPHGVAFLRAVSLAAGVSTAPRETKTNVRGEANLRV